MAFREDMTGHTRWEPGPLARSAQIAAKSTDFAVSIENNFLCEHVILFEPSAKPPTVASYT